MRSRRCPLPSSRAGRRYALRLDFSTAAPQPACSLNWESFSVDRQRIPSQYLYPVGDGGATQVPQPRRATEAIDPFSYEFGKGQSQHGLDLPRTDQGPLQVGYRSIHLGTGVTRFRTQCHTWSRATGDNKVEVRIDAPDGPLLGTFIAPPSDTPVPVEMPLTRKVVGIHDLYLINIQDPGNQWVTFKEFRFE